jgi:hypothetical protein
LLVTYVLIINCHSPKNILTTFIIAKLDSSSIGIFSSYIDMKLLDAEHIIDIVKKIYYNISEIFVCFGHLWTYLHRLLALGSYNH